MHIRGWSVQRAPNQGLGGLREFLGHRSGGVVRPRVLAMPSAPSWVSGGSQGKPGPGCRRCPRGWEGSEVDPPRPFTCRRRSQSQQRQQRPRRHPGGTTGCEGAGTAGTPRNPQYRPEPSGVPGAPGPPLRPAQRGGVACARTAPGGGAVAKRRRPHHGLRRRRGPVRV